MSPVEIRTTVMPQAGSMLTILFTLGHSLGLVGARTSRLSLPIDWGRYAELYGFEDDTNELFVESVE